jgi:low affinity Fe/Cu permease
MTSRLKNLFGHLATHASRALGSPVAFLLAVLGILVWAGLGPALGYSENWQLVVNTATTIITFLSVFLIQNTQNRESKAMQLKLDEILRCLKEARNDLIDMEDQSEETLEKAAREFRLLHDAQCAQSSDADPAQDAPHR